ncbi:NAD(P)-dependent oxidoreductase [Hoeflea sp. G2-23]|uniref:NAD(P)-dependent oxidoreductase n=1 Tax=Hoeflea algicola TaxID=2983763 RepID=A0ABT3Z9V5_9HYPH|nr:NAD(P)-dependent oxidoreductase [Hoeflea algicola]MCY0148575.1 NAD(P)-dependent oxidoreductase [Hoeflea algicola]
MGLGFAGLGRMGRRMAANCARAGFEVSVWNRSAAAAEELAAQCGVGVAGSPADLASRCDVVVSMLADDAAARTVYLGNSGLIATQGAATLVEMGTMSPALVAELAACAETCGKRFVDAPVSGATEAAGVAQLLIMAGASQEDFPELEAVFAAMGRKTIWLGASGNGAIMKLAVNMLIHGLNQTLCEALALTARAGIGEATAYDVIENSAAAAPMLKYRRSLYLDERAHDVSFTVDLAAKDMGFALDLARQLGVAMPQSEITLSVLKEAIAACYGGRDMASILSFMKEKSV